MASQAPNMKGFSTALLTRWQQINEKIIALAEAFPSERFDDPPRQDVRTFADVLRHLAFWNQYVTESARGGNPDGAPNELPRYRFPNKAALLEVLRKSAAEATEALREEGGNAKEELCLDFLQHSAEHYGQLVVYSRLAGIVPPASR